MPQYDCRDGGLLRFCAAEVETARRVRRDVLATRGPVLGTLAAGAMPIADRVSRRRLERSGDPYREELATISALVGRPGVTALNLSYEWGCTSLAFETEGVPRLTRVLDWPYHGLGRRVAAVDLQGPAGPFTVLTWPGVSSVLQASAPGRFAAALNQAPEPRSGRGGAHDWFAAKRRFLKSRGMLPGHLLRLVFETAPDFSEARRMLAETPVCVPAIYTMAGTRPGEGCVIERLETAARIQPMRSGSAAAANHWKSDLGASGNWRSRGDASDARADLAPSDLAAWHRTGELHAPIANATTRLVMSAVPATGSLVAQGWESDGPVTALTTLAA